MKLTDWLTSWKNALTALKFLINSQPLKHKVAEDVLHAVVEEHDDLVSVDLGAPVQHQLHHGVEVGLAGRLVPRVHILALKASEEQLAGSDVVAILKRSQSVSKWRSVRSVA